MVVRGRKELNEDLADYSDTRLLDGFINRQIVELAYKCSAVLLKRVKRRILKRFAQLRVPFFVQFVCASRNDLVWTHAVQNTHQKIAVNKRFQTAEQDFRTVFESRVLLKTVCA